MLNVHLITNFALLKVYYFHCLRILPYWIFSLSKLSYWRSWIFNFVVVIFIFLTRVQNSEPSMSTIFREAVKKGDTCYINYFFQVGSLSSLDLKSEGTGEGKGFCTLLYMPWGTCHTLCNLEIHSFSIQNQHFLLRNRQYGDYNLKTGNFALLLVSNLVIIC